MSFRKGVAVTTEVTTTANVSVSSGLTTPVDVSVSSRVAQPVDVSVSSGVATSADVSVPGGMTISRSCAFCHRESPSLLRCSRCQEVSYCDTACQRGHFREHKPFCELADKRVTPVERDQRVRDTLRGYELEIAFESGDDVLHQHYGNCRKNPGHVDFTPVADFKLEHLPQAWRSQALLEAIRLFAKITVQLRMRGVSADRPPGAYLYDLRGRKNFSHVGTGSVGRIEARGEMEKDACPCHPDETPRPWLKIVISTARHVVYDDSEVKGTSVIFGYDTDKDLNNAKEVVRMRPVTCVITENSRDRVELVCATHDLKFINIHKNFMSAKVVCENLIKSFPKDEQLAVVVSHPHGCCKQITTGLLREHEAVEDEQNGFHAKVFLYDTPTCPGSSGAPIWVLGQTQGVDILPPVHSGNFGRGYNESGPVYFLPYQSTAAGNDPTKPSDDDDEISALTKLVFPDPAQAVIDFEINYFQELQKEKQRMHQFLDASTESQRALKDGLAEAESQRFTRDQRRAYLNDELKRQLNSPTRAAELAVPEWIDQYEATHDKILRKSATILQESSVLGAQIDQLIGPMISFSK